MSYGVEVTPKGATAPTRTANTGGHSESFDVQNTGSVTNTFSFACAGATGVSCGTPLPSPVTLASQAMTSVSMPYSVGAAGTGTLTLTATGTNASDDGYYTVPITASGGGGGFVPSAVTSGAFTKDSRYLLQEAADSYDAYGRITQLADARNALTNYAYGGNQNAAFLTQVTRVNDGSGTTNLVTDLAYDSDGYLVSIKDEGGSFRYFTYDLFGRLRQVRNHGNTAVRAYGYSYSRTSGNGWVFQPGTPNAVVDSTYLQQAPTVVSVVGTEYLDGLGRPIQTVVREGTATSYFVTATQYDAMGRPWRAWKPYPRTTAGYDPSFTTNATSHYNTYHATATAKPYGETTYTADGLARVKRVTPEFISSAPPPARSPNTPTAWTPRPRSATPRSRMSWARRRGSTKTCSGTG